MPKGRIPILVAALWVLAGSIASAQTRGGAPGGAPMGSASVAAGYLYQFGTAISGGGEYQDLPRLCQRRRNGHDRFADRARAGPYVRPRGVHLLRTVRPGGSRPLGYDPPDRVQPVDAPLHLPRLADSRSPLSIGYAGEEGAEPGDALVYGAVISATKTIGPDLSLGLGAGAFRQIDRWRVFPFLSVRWRINDRWRLSNPLRVGPAGPAGLELAYSIDGNWEAAAGGAYRSYRFRLDEDGTIPGGIGEIRGIPLFARLSRTWRHGWRADLYAGVLLGGKLGLEDGRGDRIGSASFDPAPLAGLFATRKF